MSHKAGNKQDKSIYKYLQNVQQKWNDFIIYALVCKLLIA